MAVLSELVYSPFVVCRELLQEQRYLQSTWRLVSPELLLAVGERKQLAPEQLQLAWEKSSACCAAALCLSLAC